MMTWRLMTWRSPLLCSLLTVASSLALAAPALANGAALFTQDPAGQVNVRATPSTQGRVLGQGQTGDRLTILRDTQRNDGYRWYYIETVEDGLEGWVRGDLVRVFAEPTSPNATITSGVYWIGPTGVGLRVEGDRYQVYDEEGTYGWRRLSELQAIRTGVLHDGQAYWCAALQMPQTAATCTVNGWAPITP